MAQIANASASSKCYAIQFEVLFFCIHKNWNPCCDSKCCIVTESDFSPQLQLNLQTCFWPVLSVCMTIIFLLSLGRNCKFIFTIWLFWPEMCFYDATRFCKCILMICNFSQLSLCILIINHICGQKYIMWNEICKKARAGLLRELRNEVSFGSVYTKTTGAIK